MAETSPHAEQYLPKWIITRFVVLDASGRWASAIHRETVQQLRQRGDSLDCVPEFQTCTTARDVLLCCEMRNTVGLILFADRTEKECLAALRGLLRRMQNLPVLLVGEDHHEELLPVMLEAGVQTALCNVKNDVPVGQWCAGILTRHSSADPAGC